MRARSHFQPAPAWRGIQVRQRFESFWRVPEKPRRFFVHISRSGGTSFGETLATHACTIAHNAVRPEWCGDHSLPDCVMKICWDIPFHDAIHVSGHYTLRFIVDNGLAWFEDSIWTSERPPQDIVPFFINHILTVLQEDEAALRPDTRVWTKQLGPVDPLGTPGPERLRTLLRDDALLPRNLVCHFLGDGTAPGANRSRRVCSWNSLADHERRQSAHWSARMHALLYRPTAASMGTPFPCMARLSADPARSRFCLFACGRQRHQAATQERIRQIHR
jgi:hypothetical protein